MNWSCKGLSLKSCGRQIALPLSAPWGVQSPEQRLSLQRLVKNCQASLPSQHGSAGQGHLGKDPCLGRANYPKPSRFGEQRFPHSITKWVLFSHFLTYLSFSFSSSVGILSDFSSLGKAFLMPFSQLECWTVNASVLPKSKWVHHWNSISRSVYSLKPLLISWITHSSVPPYTLWVLFWC